MSQDTVEHLADELAAEGCVEADPVADPVRWRLRARSAAARLGRSDVVIRVRQGILSACLSGWPRDAAERTIQAAALRRAAVASWIGPLVAGASERSRAKAPQQAPAAPVARVRSNRLRVVRDPSMSDD